MFGGGGVGPGTGRRSRRFRNGLRSRQIRRGRRGTGSRGSRWRGRGLRCRLCLLRRRRGRRVGVLGAGGLRGRRGERESNDEKKYDSFIWGNRSCGSKEALSPLQRSIATRGGPKPSLSMRGVSASAAATSASGPDAHAMHRVAVDAGRFDIDVIDAAATRGVGDALGIGAIAERAELQIDMGVGLRGDGLGHRRRRRRFRMRRIERSHLDQSGALAARCRCAPPRRTKDRSGGFRGTARDR